MSQLLNILTEAFFLIFLSSLFVIGLYLYRAKVYTWLQLRFNFMWPRIIFEYRDHTRKFTGKTGYWFYVSKFSFFILFALLLIEASLNLSSVPFPVRILIIIGAVIIIPSIGFVIYNLSKDKYF
jgi:hypothetical protein